MYLLTEDLRNSVEIMEKELCRLRMKRDETLNRIHDQRYLKKKDYNVFSLNSDMNVHGFHKNCNFFFSLYVKILAKVRI